MLRSIGGTPNYGTRQARWPFSSSWELQQKLFAPSIFGIFIISSIFDFSALSTLASTDSTMGTFGITVASLVLYAIEAVSVASVAEEDPAPNSGTTVVIFALVSASVVLISSKVVPPSFSLKNYS